MKYIKYSLVLIVMLIAGMYGWYLMATAINEQVDYAAFGIIEDTLVSNSAYDLSKLRELEILLDQGDIEATKKLISEQMDLKLNLLNSCISEACKELQEFRSGKEL